MKHRVVRLGQVVEINPSTKATGSADDLVAFLAMADIGEEGRVVSVQQRPLAEVRKGYTVFQTDDVLLAKITPCFENGKAAVVESLPTQIGFGSTEFHVLRPTKDVDPKFLFHLVWNPNFRRLGASRMTGSAGQKRVPAAFLADYEFSLPSLQEQQRIATILDKADSLRRKRQEATRLSDEFLKAVFVHMFGAPGDAFPSLPTRPLGDICRFFAGNSLPEGEPFTGQLDGVLHIKVGDMNLLGNESVVSTSREWSANGAGGIIAPQGAILIPKRGGAIATNKKRVLGRPCALDPNLMAIGAGPALRQELLFQWFKLFDLSTITSGSAVPQLNKGDLSPLRIVVPPVDQQDRFAAIAQRVASIMNMQAIQFDDIESACRALTDELLSHKNL